MWYKFEDGKPIGTPRIRGYQVAWYDMDRLNGDCFDESFYKPEDINKVITYVETIEDEGHCDRTRVFAIFDDDEYELKLEKLDKNKRYSNFYD